MSDQSAPNVRQDILAAQRELARSEAQAIVDRERAKRSELAKIYGKQWVKIEDLRLDGDPQPRVSLDTETVKEYAETMQRSSDAEHVVVDKELEPFPPITVYRKGKDLWLADGFHRIAAAQKKGYKTIQAEIQSGGLRDAIKYSIQANATHGKRRTNEDKRRAVLKALQDEEWVKLSDRALAEMCKVSHPTVSKVRKELEEAGDINAVLERTGADGRTINTDKIGSTGKSYQSSTPTPSKADLKAVGPTIRKREQLPDLEENTQAEVIQPNPMEVEVAAAGASLDARAREEVSTRKDSLMRVLTREETGGARLWGQIGKDIIDFDYELIVAPMPKHLSWAVHALRETRLQDRERGAVIIGTEIYLIWSSREFTPPTTAESLEELVAMMESEVMK